MSRTRTAALILFALAISPVLTPAALSQAAPAGATVLETGTQLVIVDVVVQDSKGHPVHGLKREDFRVTEDKTPQSVRNFEEHTGTSAPQNAIQIPKLPPGTFTDYTPVPPDSTLNILLLDALNTPMTSQTYVRYQLQQYVKNARPGTRIAIFGLANRLILLQGFTSDPQALKDAVDHKLIPRSSDLLDDPTGSGVDQIQASDLVDPNAPGQAELAANLQQFEAQTAAMEIQFRLQYTLDAFNTLGHYLANFPGRKNLIWFSGSFPINILPDPTIQNGFAIAQLNQDEFRETTNLLTKAQVAVYPVDARGLLTPPMYNAASSGRAYSTPQKFAAANAKFSASQAAEHSTMDALAEDTGGRAYYNTNGLTQAVADAIDAGSNYYTLTYTPTDRRQDGAYRNIRVEFTNLHPDWHLSFRHGYYANDAKHPTAPSDSPTSTTPSAAPSDRAVAYQRAAMSRGAPTPQDLLFKVRVLPASATTETTLAPGNTADASVPAAGPFRRYDIDLVALPTELTLNLQPDGRRTGSVEFIAYVFDRDGKLLNADGKTVSLNLTQATYDRFLHSSLQGHLEISVPTRYESYLRIGVHDVAGNHFGVVEIPVASVSHLAPPTYPTATPPAAPTTSTPQPAAATPSTPPASPPAAPR